MRTYDPADYIRYVHTAPGSATPAAAVDAGGATDALPAGYANLSPRTCLAEAPETAAGGSARPALVVLPGGAAAGTDASPASPALRLA